MENPEYAAKERKKAREAARNSDPERRREIQRAYHARHADDPAYRERLRRKWNRKHWKKHPERLVTYRRRVEAQAACHRICTSCRASFPATSEFFGSAKRTADKLAAECKKCARNVKKVWWDQLSQEERRVRNSKQRAARATAPGIFTGHDIKALFVRQNACCLYCGIKIGRNYARWHVDHFMPLSRGGSNFPENLVVACEPCNRAKYNKMPWEWLPDQFSPPSSQ
ncbi:HNH endonuclease [Deinococcus ruber]|uniref:HNH endonuclease n=1 Tax=Deinococcus ruber TaxID=1848197 RepID=UPI00357115B5